MINLIVAMSLYHNKIIYAALHTGMITREMPTPQWPEPRFMRMKPASPQAGPQEFLISQ